MFTDSKRKIITLPSGDDLGRIITKALKDEAEQVCTHDIRDKMWTNFSNRLGLVTKDISLKTD